MKTVNPEAGSLAEAARTLRGGGVVAYPTETVYGLGADPFSPDAVERLFQAKGRASNQPILLIVADRAQLDEVVAEIPPEAQACIDAFWPGPLTLLFPRSDALAAAVTAGRPQVAVRMTSHPIAQALCRAARQALTSTSANRAGEPAASSVAALPPLPGVELVVDGGPLPPSAPSTLYDPVAGRVLREGAVPAEAIARAMRPA
jgi:L-threonylcarbamoyladenylate synthase